MQKSDKKVVYVGFAADIVHHGHLNIIKVAASLGRVVIGLLTDEAIFSYKRQTIIPWDKRRKVVEALTGVDEVIAQHTHDYSPNLLALKPDYVVHGTDWRDGVQAKVRQKVIDLLATWGGEMVEPEYTSNVSTTEIIQHCHQYEVKRRQGELPKEVLVSGADKRPSLPSELVEKIVAMRPLAYVGVASDFIHHGHVHIINEAQKLGSVVVGILTDDAVTAYRGKPSVTFEGRAAIFRGVKGVAAVVPQHQLAYETNLKLLKPEFVVHGDNWRTDHQKSVRDNVLATLEAWGGQLVEPAFAADADPDPSLDSKDKDSGAGSAGSAGSAGAASGGSKAESKGESKAVGTPASSPTKAHSSITQQIVDTCYERIVEKEQKDSAKRAAAASAASKDPVKQSGPVAVAAAV